jgi:hypothetical protein
MISEYQWKSAAAVHPHNYWGLNYTEMFTQSIETVC